MASENNDTYGVLAGNVLNLNSGTSQIIGDVGSYNTITGSGTTTVSGDTNIGSSIDNALSNAANLYSLFIGLTPDTTNSGSDIGGMTFIPGVNALTNVAVTMSSPITLNGNGFYLFQVPNSDLVTDPTLGSLFFNFLNGAKASDVYWSVNGNVNLQTIGSFTTSFSGSVLTPSNITLGTNSSSASGLIAFSSSPNGIVTLNQNLVVCKNAQTILDNRENGYINIETTLSDNQAIQIKASNINGGILIKSGFGGTAINSTNSISMNANGASNLSTTLGNVLIQSQPALVNLDGGSGINIGCDNNLARTLTPIQTPVINIGSSNTSKTINIGNTTSSTGVNINTGSGNLILNSNSGKINIQGNNSASDSINLDASQGTNGVTISTGSSGLNANSGSGKTQIISNNINVDAIRLDASGGSGGVFLAAGSSGISIGNDGVSHPIVIGNTSGSSNVIIQSGTGGISIGNDSSTAQLQLANGTGAKTVTIGNTVSASRLYTRWQNSWIKHQEPYVQFYDNDESIGAFNTWPCIFLCVPGFHITQNRTITLDSATNFVSALGGVAAQDNDAIEFTVINASDNVDFYYSLTMGTNGTMIGNNKIQPLNNNVIGGTGTYQSSGSATFRLVINVTNTTYNVFRIN